MAGYSVEMDSVLIQELTVNTLSGMGDGQITNAMISAAAAIATSKQLNRVQAKHRQDDGSDVAATGGDGDCVYICDKSSGATIKKVSALCQDAPSGGGTETITIDVKRYDYSETTLESVLSATFTITDSQADYEVVNGTLNSAKVDLDSGDSVIVTVAVAGSGGVQGQGLLVQVEIDETGA